MTRALEFAPAGRPDSLHLFAGRLQEFIDAYPDQLRARAFKETSSEQALWDAVEAWNQMVAGWKPDPAGLSPENAKIRGESCGAFLTRYPVFPGAEQVAVYQRFAEAIARRGPGKDHPATKLQALLSDPLIKEVWMLTVKKKDENSRATLDRYYTTQKPAPDGGKVEFPFIISFAGEEQSREITMDRVVAIDEAPQSKIAARFRPVLADAKKMADWETVMIDLVGATLHQPDIDPILQVALVRKIISAAADGSEPVRSGLEPMRKQVDESNLDVDVPWMNPEGPRLDRIRLEAARLAHGLRATVPPATQIKGLRDQIAHSVAQVYRPVGWLAQEGEGWKVQSGAAAPPDGDLWVVLRLAEKRGQWRKVGRWTQGKAAIDARDGSALAEGRPVFIMVSAS
jgi:hypothetical protein